MPTIEERLTALEEMVGTKYIGKSSDELAAALVPASTILGGRYPLFLSDYQIRVGIADISSVPGPKGDKGDPGPAGGSSGEAPQLVDGLLWYKSTNGIGIAFESDTNFQNGQRSDSNKAAGYRQVFNLVLSDDGGGGIHQNVVWPEDGGRAYIPDPTRFAASYRLDRQCMMSINIYRAGEQFAPGKYAVSTVHKGQLAVLIPDENGDLTLRLPQGGRLLVEKGNGNNDRENGHKAAISRQEVMLGADVGSPAIGGLPGGGGT